MRCAIMQPSYLPWAGYFNLMTQVEFFVFLDDVQFCRSSWHQRNRILRHDQIEFITLPVKKSGARKKITEVEVDFIDVRYFDFLKEKMHSAYSGRPFYTDVVELIELAVPKESSVLSEFNIFLLNYCVSKVGLECKLIKSSDLKVSGIRSDRLENICIQLGCNRYLTPVGSLPYLHQDHFGQRSGIALDVQDFIPSIYDQGCANFVSHLSVLDVVANIGWGSFYSYIKK
ncbi:MULTISPECIES: WbqC family protein [Deefgea]|uniref:CS domain-containing protein n=1 Tax=Deefgea chitinilytica TaxID=570276 RepID=A0ABS2C9Q4_9NEIS|nr:MULTISPECIES: WbqC family protein [Deefgea]MBM5570881.1 hypothetical protein [Deefgea chitinilytica]MBM9888110.1 WbqC family protein [Deefgea sp. CFH1-16]